MARYKRKKSEGKIAHKKTTIDGITFDSKMESDYYVYLKEEKKAGRIKNFDLQPEFILQPKHFIMNGKVHAETDDTYKEMDKLRKKHNKENPDNKIQIIQAIKYISDFQIINPDDSVKTIDVKGIKTADFKLKEKMFNFKYPSMNLECVIWDGPSKSWLEYSEYEKAKKERKKKKTKK